MPMSGTCTVMKVIPDISFDSNTIPYLPDLNLTMIPIQSSEAKTKTPVCYPDSLCHKMIQSRLDEF